MGFYPDFFTNESKGSGKSFEKELIGDGLHPARLVGIVDLGLQTNSFKPEQMQPRLVFMFSILDEVLENEGNYKGKMKMISKSFTNSTFERAGLVKDFIKPLGIEADKNGRYNITKFLNMPLGITISHKTVQTENGPSVVNTIAGFSQLMKGFKAPESDVEPYLYMLAHHDEAALEKVPEWCKKKINFQAAGINYSYKPKEKGAVNGDFA